MPLDFFELEHKVNFFQTEFPPGEARIDIINERSLEFGHEIL